MSKIRLDRDNPRYLAGPDTFLKSDEEIIIFARRELERLKVDQNVLNLDMCFLEQHLARP